ncbi:hypothetical protein IC575_005617 [Cucumis melo]
MIFFKKNNFNLDVLSFSSHFSFLLINLSPLSFSFRQKTSRQLSPFSSHRSLFVWHQSSVSVPHLEKNVGRCRC